MTTTPVSQRILALHPTTRGLGFAFLDGLDLLDWGLKHASGLVGSPTLPRAVEAVIHRHCPDVIVMEEGEVVGCRRRKRICELFNLISERARHASIPIMRVPRMRMLAHHARDRTLPTKCAVAAMLALRYPELGPHVPPPRSTWESEDARLGYFMAIAFALTYLRTKSTPQSPNTTSYAQSQQGPRH